MLPPVLDTHCHLDVREFSDDREAVIARAQQQRVTAMLTLGTDLSSSRRAVSLADRFDSVYAAIGLHPNDASRAGKIDWARWEELAAHPRVIAWGEIGLDYHWDTTPPKLQKQVFRDQLALARNLDLPVVVHIRKAHDDTLAILAEPAFTQVRGILHCWSGDLVDAQKGVDLGYLIGVGGPVTYKKSVLPEIVRALPWDTLVVETDAPYLAPVPRRGKRNEPALVRHTFDAVVEIKSDLQPQQAAAALWFNFRRLFERFRVSFETACAA
jgi:TatD DNase family protein